MMTRVSRGAAPGAAAACLWGATTAAAQCSAWLPTGALPWPHGTVAASTLWDADGPGPQPARLAIGGLFTTAASVDVGRVALWDGSAWHAPGAQPFTGTVLALGTYNGDLIAGSALSPPNPLTAIARWNGSSWQTLGAGVSNGAVHALAEHEGLLYVGGTFASVGGLPGTAMIAAWDGSSWQGVGAANHYVYTLRKIDGVLYAGGVFTQIGGTSAARIARRQNGAWHPLGAGLPGSAQDITQFNGQVVACGPFAGGAAAWDGTSWRTLGAGIQGTQGAPRAVVAYGNSLIVAGDFWAAGGGTIYSLARWDGAQWHGMGGVYSAPISTLTLFNGGVAAGGYYSVGSSFANPGVITWNGAAWRPLSAGTDTRVFALAEHNGTHILAGEFTSAGGVEAGHIAAWDGLEWSDLAGGTNGPVHAVRSHAGELVAGGAFTMAGGEPASRVAAWDGASWAPLGTGVNGAVSALGGFGDDLVASGSFASAGGTPALRIAAWDGSAWSPLGTGLNAPAWAIAAYAGEVVAGGEFSVAGGVPASGIARWDGSAWHPLGSGMGGTYPYVYALAEHSGWLFAGGMFTSAGGTAGPRIARWSGSAWQSVGGGVFSPQTTFVSVDALAVYNARLIAGGVFERAGAFVVNGIAAWNGSVWQALESGVGPSYGSSTVPPARVFALAPFRSELIVGGDFVTAGSQPALRWGRWSDTGAPWIARQPGAQTVAGGGTAAFSVAAPSGYEGLLYQWRRNGAPITNGPAGASPGGGTVSGAAAPDLEISAVQLSDAGQYDCVVSNACGAATSAAGALIVFSCYPDCNQSGALTIADFTCFQSKFAAADPYADCNQSGSLTISDFTCYQARFVAGCP